MSEKTIYINGEDVKVEISELRVHQSSDNKFFNIHFTHGNKHTCLHVWFSYLFTQTTAEGQNIDVDKIADAEIRDLINDVWDELFNNEEYFVYFTPHWKLVNHRFHPFLEK